MDYGLTIGITQILQVYTAPSYAYTAPSYAYTKLSYAHTELSYAYTKPSYAYTAPSYAHTEPSYAYTAPSYAYTKLSYTSTEASYSSCAPCASCTRRPSSAGVWSECAEQGGVGDDSRAGFGHDGGQGGGDLGAGRVARVGRRATAASLSSKYHHSHKCQH